MELCIRLLRPPPHLPAVLLLPRAVLYDDAHVRAEVQEARGEEVRGQEEEGRVIDRRGSTVSEISICIFY